MLRKLCKLKIVVRHIWKVFFNPFNAYMIIKCWNYFIYIHSIRAFIRPQTWSFGYIYEVVVHCITNCDGCNLYPETLLEICFVVLSHENIRYWIKIFPNIFIFVLVFLLLTFNRSCTFIWCFRLWLWSSKQWLKRWIIERNLFWTRSLTLAQLHTSISPPELVIFN